MIVEGGKLLKSEGQHDYELRNRFNEGKTTEIYTLMATNSFIATKNPLDL